MASGVSTFEGSGQNMMILSCPFCQKRKGEHTIEVLENYVIATKMVCTPCLKSPKVIQLMAAVPTPRHVGIDLAEGEDRSVVNIFHD